MNTLTDEDKSYNTRMNDSEILEGDYRGNPMMIIRMTAQDKFPFQFGVRKARLMVKHFEAIKKFSERSLKPL